METMFNHICRDLADRPADAIPFLQPGSIMPASNILDPVDPINVSLEPSSLYDALKGVGEVYGLGFRLLRNFDMSQLYFDVYAGSDRTSGQNVLPPVHFLAGPRQPAEHQRADEHRRPKNVAFVYSDQGSMFVYGGGVDASSPASIARSFRSRPTTWTERRPTNS
jgi:hypothetical protein